MKASEVKPGRAFRYVVGNELMKDVIFIKLDENRQHQRINVVNTSSWVAAYVSPDAEVEEIRGLTVLPNESDTFDKHHGV